PRAETPTAADPAASTPRRVIKGNFVNTPADMVGKRVGMAFNNQPVLDALCTLNDVAARELR
ncbi:MAG: hypothetical protein AAFQ50_10105, partial [Pseudomonadota bacterium]